ncbi:MAG: peptidase M28, partial [Acidobacteria bacterium]|nr:peptidase M28 [Acidobacteriota bacterium]
MLTKFRRIALPILMLSMLCALSPNSNGQRGARLTPTAIEQPALVQRYQQLIAPASLASRLYFLASDLFEGRETTTRGQKLAALYLASQYRALGLAPKGTVKADGPLSPAAYLQRFPLYRLAPTATQLEVLNGESRVASSSFSAETHDDLSYFMYGNKTSVSGGVVFAGYGIADDQLGYNDYAALAAKGISINGKWVMRLADEPLSDAKTSLLPTANHQLSNWTTKLRKKIALLAAGKPAGILEVKLASPLVTNTFEELAAAASRNARRVG